MGRTAVRPLFVDMRDSASFFGWKAPWRGTLGAEEPGAHVGGRLRGALMLDAHWLPHGDATTSTDVPLLRLMTRFWAQTGRRVDVPPAAEDRCDGADPEDAVGSREPPGGLASTLPLRVVGYVDAATCLASSSLQERLTRAVGIDLVSQLSVLGCEDEVRRLGNTIARACAPTVAADAPRRAMRTTSCGEEGRAATFAMARSLSRWLPEYASFPPLSTSLAEGAVRGRREPAARLQRWWFNHCWEVAVGAACLVTSNVIGVFSSFDRWVAMGADPNRVDDGSTLKRRLERLDREPGYMLSVPPRDIVAAQRVPHPPVSLVASGYGSQASAFPSGLPPGCVGYIDSDQYEQRQPEGHYELMHGGDPEKLLDLVLKPLLPATFFPAAAAGAVVVIGWDVMAQARAALLLAHCGLRDVRVCHGGMPAWVAAEPFVLDTVPPAPLPRPSVSVGRSVKWMSLQDVAAVEAAVDGSQRASPTLLDVRGIAERRGDTSGYEYFSLPGGPADFQPMPSSEYCFGEGTNELWHFRSSHAGVHVPVSREDAGSMLLAAVCSREKGGLSSPPILYCGGGWRASELLWYCLMYWGQRGLLVADEEEGDCCGEGGNSDFEPSTPAWRFFSDGHLTWHVRQAARPHER